MIRSTQTVPTRLDALRTHLGFRRFFRVRDVHIGVRSSSCDFDSVSARRLPREHRSALDDCGLYKYSRGGGTKRNKTNTKTV